MISGVQSALSGLMALQKKSEASAHNTANVNTDGYKKVRVTISGEEPQGVTARAETVNTPGPLVPEMTASGEMEMVEKSNVELTEELPNQMLSRRFFQANLKTVQIHDEMLGSLLDIKG